MKTIHYLYLLFAIIALGIGMFVTRVSECNRMDRFARAGFPPTLSERIQCEDVGIKLRLVPNETTE